METQPQILSLLLSHRQKFPEQAEELDHFVSFVKNHVDEQLFDRKNFTGHITASAFIVDEKAEKLLLLKHKFLDRWLQPGGHIDPADESLMTAALREAQEETGIAAADLHCESDTPFDFESHSIPENIRKNEAAHYHHDTRFLFSYAGAKEVSIAAEESTDSKWISLDNLANDADFKWIVHKIKLYKAGVL